MTSATSTTNSSATTHPDGSLTTQPGGSLTTQPEPRPAPRRNDRGEGVISTAIAVLIVAILGAAMWLSFNTIWKDADERINAKVETIAD